MPEHACAASVWTSHALRLNTLTQDETMAAFERFCPPFRFNNRRGSGSSARSGKGPIPDLAHAIEGISDHGSSESKRKLNGIIESMQTKADAYEKLASQGPLSALFDILPAWCLQNRIDLVNGGWWDDPDAMSVIIDSLHSKFQELGMGEGTCRCFHDSCFEALDAYHRDLSSEPDAFGALDIPELIEMVRSAREAEPSFETDGYGNELPMWLISKEQLIWNVIVSAIYGPATARPLLMDSPALLAEQGFTTKTDVITDLARTSFTRYTADRSNSHMEEELVDFSSLPSDLRDSSIACISSINSKLATLDYEVMPASSCYPERRVASFTDSEVECLAILEHRRWLKERERAGWTYSESKDVTARKNPYLVPWEELPERAKEWNQSTVRSIPSLLASVNLAVVR